MARTAAGAGRATRRTAHKPQEAVAAEPGSGVRDTFGNEAPTTAAPIKRRPGRPSRVSRHDDDAPRNRRGEIVSRVGVREGFFNEFDVPESDRNPKFDTYWARQSCLGKPDHANMNSIGRGGWEPAEPKNYPNVMPDQRGKRTLERDGFILMERPVQLSNRAFDEQRYEALSLRETQAESFGTRKLPKGFDKGGRSGDGKFDASRKLERGRPIEMPKEFKPQYAYATPGDDD